MTDRDAFIRAIIADPDADLPRLVFADWLDENGECNYATFIRVQCELARIPSRGIAKFFDSVAFEMHPPRRDRYESLDGMSAGIIDQWATATILRDDSLRPGDIIGLRQNGGYLGPFAVNAMTVNYEFGSYADLELRAIGEPQQHTMEYWQSGLKKDRLRARERKLLATQYIGTDFPFVCSNKVGWTPEPARFGRWPADFHRGFVEVVQCSWADWQTHADALREVAPIRKVKLTTRPTWTATRFDSGLVSLIEATTDDAAIGRLNVEYPGIEFELPPIVRE